MNISTIEAGRLTNVKQTAPARPIITLPAQRVTTVPPLRTRSERQSARQQVSRKLDQAAAAGLVRGSGGKLPRPRAAAVNRGARQVSDAVTENRG
jgi:hypothetical protein